MGLPAHRGYSGLATMKRVATILKKAKYPLLVVFVSLCVLWCFCLPKQLFKNPTSTVLEDKDGDLLGARIAEDGQWRFPHNDSVPNKFKVALVQFEDRTFYDHPGFSIRGFVRALKQNISHGRVVSGGSTISMQVIRLSRKDKPRSIKEKLIEVFMATRMELTYSKKEIIALWASNAPMGGNVVGLDAASWRYFGRSPENLSWAEAATLAVLPNAPSLMYPGRNMEPLLAKRNRLLKQLHKVGKLDDMSYELALKEPLPGKPHPLPNIVPHLIDRSTLAGLKGQRIQTTIDQNLQAQVNQIVGLHHDILKENKVYNAAALVISTRTGEVVAYCGNTAPDDDGESHGNAVDIITAPRSTGSILKPFLYATMLNDGGLTPDMLVPDVPTLIGTYAPKNYDENYDGAVPASRALAKSLNVPAVRMLRSYGTERFHRKLQGMGMTTLNHPASHYGLTLILGGAEATLWDLAYMYSTMGRTLVQYPTYKENLTQEPFYIKAINDKKYTPESLDRELPFISPGAAWSTLNAMVEVTRPEDEVNWKVFSSSGKIAWKTGTSFGNRDAWAVGLNPEYVVAVWVGNADGEGRPGVVGLSAAAPILFDIFDRLPRGAWFDQPYDDMQQVAVCQLSGHRASKLCEEVDTTYIPLSAMNSIACPYHKLVHLSFDGRHRVNSGCADVSSMRHEAWFILPPTMEWYYKRKNPQYRNLPQYRSDCLADISENPMAVIYPKTPSSIYVPVQLDGTLSRTVFEATHRDHSATIYWHIDEEYIGATTDIHQMELAPAVGEHYLTLVDDAGMTVKQRFSVVGK